MEEDKYLANSPTCCLTNQNIRLKQHTLQTEDFFLSVCHHLQDSLRKIKSYGFLSQEYSQLMPPEVSGYLTHMINESDHMNQLILSLLEFSKTSKHVPNMQKVDLNLVIEQVVKDLEAPLRHSQGRITVANQLPSIQGDVDQMHQLFSNIFGNALQYTNRQPHVIVHSEIYCGAARLMIQDNGIGIAEKYTDQVFLPFFRIKGEKSIPGSGMGLSICQKIVERHQGNISIESSEKLGTIVVVDLPLHQDTEEELLA